MCSKMNIADTAVLLVCAGNATRMGGIHKILHPLGEMTVLEHSLQTFARCQEITELVIICRPRDEAEFREVLQHITLPFPVQIAYGGDTRQQSVKNGFAALTTDASYIAIHDGARPLLRAEDASHVIRDAHVFGAATLGVPVKDTIKIVDNGLVVGTPARESLWQIQTPQVFSAHLIIPAYKDVIEHEHELLEQGVQITDDAMVVENVYRCPVYLVEGSYENIKITTPEDLKIAEIFVSR